MLIWWSAPSLKSPRLGPLVRGIPTASTAPVFRKILPSTAPKEALIACDRMVHLGWHLSIWCSACTCLTMLGKGCQNFKHSPRGCLVFGLSWEKLLTMCMYTPHRCMWCLCWLFPWSSKTNSCHELGLAYRGDGWSIVLACTIYCPFPSGAVVPVFQCFAERFWHIF